MTMVDIEMRMKSTSNKINRAHTYLFTSLASCAKKNPRVPGNNFNFLSFGLMAKLQMEEDEEFISCMVQVDHRKKTLTVVCYNELKNWISLNWISFISW